MLVTKGRLAHLSARARHNNVPLTPLLPVVSILSQIGKCPTGPAKASLRPSIPQRQAASGKPAAPARPAAFGQPPMPPLIGVIPRPEGRGICFSIAHDTHASIVFNTLRTRFPDREPQPKQFHTLPNSSLFAKDITSAFSTSSQILRHSLA